jgi:acid phosphatase class B
MTYTGAEGKSNKGLARRRAAEFDMYKGDPVNYSRTDAEVATLTTSLGVKPEDIVMIGTDDSARIEAAESVCIRPAACCNALPRTFWNPMPDLTPRPPGDWRARPDARN